MTDAGKGARGAGRLGSGVMVWNAVPMSLAGYALSISVLAAIFSAGSAVYARRSATEAKRANDLEESRDRQARRPRLHFELTGDPVRAQLTVRNDGAEVVTSLRLEVVGNPEVLQGTGFGSANLIEPTANLPGLLPAVPQTLDMIQLMAGTATSVTLLCTAETDDDRWRFQTTVSTLPEPWAFLE